MACCTDHCRMETTEEAAQKACAQTRQALGPRDTLSSASSSPVFQAAKFLPHNGPFPLESLSPPDFVQRMPRIEKGVSRPRRNPPSVKIYTANHSLLI